MWKVYKHVVGGVVTLVDGNEEKLVKPETSTYYTVEDRESRPPKMVVDPYTGNTPKIFGEDTMSGYKEAVKQCALLLYKDWCSRNKVNG